MCAKPLTRATLIIGALVSSTTWSQEFPELPTQEKMELSKLNDLGRLAGIGVLVASNVDAGCRHFAMATSTSSGLPVWNVVLYTGELKGKMLNRVLWATSIQNISNLEFEGDVFKAVVAGDREIALSFRTHNCGG
ncbi:hypothetical protein [Tahibacter soli]|uniref:Uncharacterized protein n=1 Tax=Tahibacter soli TaxID=2983605 RepID=A0A9X3YI00_9GAMM|nr:hypothetical protein [Tahibacter soli]MDC8012577.1 hypothetical protein [Tahibacter soli]